MVSCRTGISGRSTSMPQPVFLQSSHRPARIPPPARLTIGPAPAKKALSAASAMQSSVSAFCILYRRDPENLSVSSSSYSVARIKVPSSPAKPAITISMPLQFCILLSFSRIAVKKGIPDAVPMTTGRLTKSVTSVRPSLTSIPIEKAVRQICFIKLRRNSSCVPAGSRIVGKNSVVLIPCAARSFTAAITASSPALFSPDTTGTEVTPEGSPPLLTGIFCLSCRITSCTERFFTFSSIVPYLSSICLCTRKLCTCKS